MPHIEIDLLLLLPRGQWMAFLSHDMVGIIGKKIEQVLMPPCKALGGELYGIQACP
jgi:hypothetical protein